MNLSRPSLEKLFSLVSVDRGDIVRNLDNIYLFDGVSRLAVLNIGGGHVVSSGYWEKFPYNNPEASEERKLEDLIDTIWYEYCVKDIIFWLTPSGRQSEQSRSTLRDRLAGKKYNHAYINLLLRCPWKSAYGYNRSALGIPIQANYENTLFIDGNLTFGLPEEASYLYTNLGYIQDGLGWVKQGELCTSCGNRTNSSLFKGKCLTCLDLTEEDLRIHSYSTKVPTILKFKGKTARKKSLTKTFNSYYNKYLSELSIEHSKKVAIGDDLLYLGLELEYERQQSVGGNAAEVAVMSMLKGHAILKSDGTINNGFEIVTCPATLDEHKIVFKAFFDNFPSEYIKTAGNCGLHIHVSRAPLSLLTQGRMIAFMNNGTNKIFLEHLAGRWSERWANIDSNRGLSYVFSSSDSRYNVLNTVNKDTLEFRMFAPADTWDKFMYKLEFCVALTDYCKPCNTEFNSIDIQKEGNFLTWLAENQKQYPELSKFIFGEKKRPEFINQKKGQQNVYSNI